MIKAVLFDVGGVLHTTSSTPERKQWFAQRVIDRLMEYGIDVGLDAPQMAMQLAVNAELYKQEVDRTRRELPTEVAWSDYYLKEQHIDREKMRYMSEELSFLYDYERPCNMRRPHLLQCIEQLKGMGMRLGIISNMLSVTLVPHFLAEYGLAPYMEVVLSSAETGIRKPDAAIFQIAQRQMGLEMHEFAYVGDTLSRDVRGVRNAQWRLAIQIHNPGTAHRDVGMAQLGYKPDYYIYDLAEVPGIIASENERESG